MIQRISKVFNPGTLELVLKRSSNDNRKFSLPWIIDSRSWWWRQKEQVHLTYGSLFQWWWQFQDLEDSTQTTNLSYTWIWQNHYADGSKLALMFSDIGNIMKTFKLPYGGYGWVQGWCQWEWFPGGPNDRLASWVLEKPSKCDQHFRGGEE